MSKKRANPCVFTGNRFNPRNRYFAAYVRQRTELCLPRAYSIQVPSATYRCTGLKSTHYEEKIMSLGTILLIILILILIGIIPTWPHSRSWGYAPSGGVGLIVIIIVVLLLLGRI